MHRLCMNYYTIFYSLTQLLIHVCLFGTDQNIACTLFEITWKGAIMKESVTVQVQTLLKETLMNCYHMQKAQQ